MKMNRVIFVLALSVLSAGAAPLSPVGIQNLAKRWVQATPDVKYLSSCELSLTWFDSELVCRLAGGHLASVTSQAEESALETILAISQTFERCPLSTPWIGLVQNRPNQYLWVNGILGISNGTAQYSNWKPGQPQLSNNGDLCAQLDMASNKWYTTRCVDSNVFACEMRDHTAPEHKLKTELKQQLGIVNNEETEALKTSTTKKVPETTKTTQPPATTTHKPQTTTTANPCPSYGTGHWYRQNANTNDTSCYYFSCSGTSYDFFSAQVICDFIGGNLVSIHDSELINFIFQTSKSHCVNSGDVWIGLFNDDGKTEFQWSDITPVDYTNWDFVDSNNGKLLCAQQQTFDNEWSLYPCSNLKRFICRVPPYF